MSAMQQPRKDDLRELPASAADAIIAERRKANGWQHFADDLIREQAERAHREFRSGLMLGMAITWGVAMVAWWLT